MDSKVIPTPYGGRIVEYRDSGGRLLFRDGISGAELLHGLSEAWYETGQKQWEGTWVNGTRHGIYTFWNADGTVRILTTFRFGSSAGRYFKCILFESIRHLIFEDGARFGRNFRGWEFQGRLEHLVLSYVDDEEGIKVSVSDGAWYRREAALLCRLR